MGDVLPATGRMTSAWVDFFIMVGAFALIAIGALIWVVYFRRTRRKHRHKRRHRRERRSVNPTLAQTGGLPPPRPPDPPDATPSQTP
jgi:uncharacterized iron-regulated membrane protein